MAGLGNIARMNSRSGEKLSRSEGWRAFRWSLGYLLPYRGLLIVGMLCALMHSALYAVGISAALPVLKVLLDEEGLYAAFARFAADQRAGVRLESAARAGLAAAGDPSAGLAVVRRVREGTAADRAGLREGDVLLGLGDFKFAPDQLSQPSGWTQTAAMIGTSHDAQTLGIGSWHLIRARIAPDAGPGTLARAIAAVQSHDGWWVHESALELEGVRFDAVEIPLEPVPMYLLAGGRLADWFRSSLGIQDRFGELVVLLAGLMVITVISNILRFLGEYQVGKCVFYSMVDLRREMLAKALRLPMGYYQHNLSDTTSQFVQDTQALSRSMLLLFGKVAREPLRAVAAFVVLIVMDAWLILLLLAAAAPCYFVIRKAGRVIHRSTTRLLTGYSSMVKNLQATFSGLKAVKAFGAEDLEAQRFAEVDRSMLRQFKLLAKVEAAMPPIIETVSLAAAAVGLLFLARAVLDGRTSTSEFLAVGVVLAAMFDPIRKVAAVWNRVQGGGAAARRIKQLLDEPDEWRGAWGAVVVGPLQDRIRLEEVRFCYPGNETPALDGVSLDVPAGRKLAIVGPNGAGKSTLVSLLPRLYELTGGRILWDGQDLAGADLASLRRQIGLMSQESIIFPLSIRENIALGRPEAGDEQIREAARRAYALDFIEDAKSCPEGFDTLLGEQGVGLSGGQRQRLVLARVILRDAPLLILDEATSAADAQSEALIATALREFSRGKTVLVIAHKLSTVQDADCIAVIDAGRLVDSGSHVELLERCDLYQRLCSLQLSGG